jgi:DNA-binding transcriptional MerR regulator
MYTVGRLAKKFGLSRSTLLYYDRIGLLKPSQGGKGEYRHYSDKDAERLAQICQYRRTGLKLQDIKRILDSPDTTLTPVLEERLEELNLEIEGLREQQRIIVGLLKNSRLFESIGVMNRATWTSLLAASGFSDDDMWRWHVAFERHAPEKHHAFLRFLCIPEDEIEALRSWAANAEPGTEKPAMP